jgi:penicillin-binding protein A
VNRQIGRLGVGLLACYLALFAMLNHWQVFAAESVRDNPDNTRGVLRAFDRPRGSIATADGVLLARTVERQQGRFGHQREYLEPVRYGHLTGWFSLELGSAGLESSYNDELAGTADSLRFRSWRELFLTDDPVGNLVLSVHDSVQQVAQEQLGDREGSVVALDPRNGDVLALWSFPSYDPNVLSTHDFAAARSARELLDDVPGSPLLAHTYQERYFPGSTFKVVTAGAGLDAGSVTVNEPRYPVTAAYTPPLTDLPIRNFGGSSCGGPLVPILEVSCNTAFAQMAVEDIGPDDMVAGAERFGFNAVPPFDLPQGVRSVFPTDFEQNLPALAQSSIGQNDVQATPLQMALVAAAVANEGRIMSPHVVREVRAGDGGVVSRPGRGQWRRALDADDAAVLRQAMVSTVNRGTARNMALEGVEVGGKTGTAEIGRGGNESHAWIIGFAGPPGGAPQVAVAVMVKAQPGQGSQSGGVVAAPIAREVLRAALEVTRADPAETSPVTTTPPDGPPPSPPPPPPTAPAPPPIAPEAPATTAAPPPPTPTAPPPPPAPPTTSDPPPPPTPPPPTEPPPPPPDP